ncbi:sacsin [Cherax quadricarinatus]
MDSKEDPPSSSKAKYFHICSEEPDDPFNYNIIEIPTVVGFLKNILAQYPDNGQIIKELVQNAEDAGATVVEVLHDERNVKCPKTHKDIQRFLKGPALCLYNDGTFTEDDWTGIRKLSDSIKKNDPLKVGQFGLGFKSVFHITDFVTIISGNKVLFMDPSEPENKMCRIISLKKLTSICPLDDCLRLWSCYISTQNITDGQFPATLFWFPLRQSPSDISNTIYTYNHVITLFESFSIEASLCLTFLKSIEKICLKRINKWNKSPVTTHEVKLISPIMTEVQQKRKVFKQKLVECKGCPSQTITCDYEVTVESVRCNQTKQQMMHILHYLPGSSDPSTVTWRGEDSCKHMPLVGIAAPVTAHSVASPTATHSDETSITTGRTTLNTGHIFCFLPLPLETDNKTNLPVQINGFFALDQNRRHVKWKTEENSIEPDVLWNEDLVSRAVVEAYFTFLQNVLSDLKEKSSPHHLETWYGLLPHIDSTKGRWKKLGVELWSRLKSMPILYSDVSIFPVVS